MEDRLFQDEICQDMDVLRQILKFTTHSLKIYFRLFFSKIILVFIHVRGTIPASQDMNT